MELIIKSYVQSTEVCNACFQSFMWIISFDLHMNLVWWATIIIFNSQMRQLRFRLRDLARSQESGTQAQGFLATELPIFIVAHPSQICHGPLRPQFYSCSVMLFNVARQLYKWVLYHLVLHYTLIAIYRESLRFVTLKPWTPKRKLCVSHGCWEERGVSLEIQSLKRCSHGRE